MKILVISQYYFPEQFLINDITEELVKKGHDITVVTGLPNYPSGRIEDRYKNIRHELVKNVKIERCYIFPRKNNMISLILNYISFAVSASVRTLRLKEEYDIVFSYQLTPVLQLIPAIIYAKIRNKKLICYCLDIAPKSGSKILKNSVGGNVLYFLYKKISKKIYSKCDLICVTSKAFIKYLNQLHNIPVKKIEYLPQHASDIFYRANIKSSNNKYPIFLFAGNIGKGASLETVILAVDIVRRKTDKKFKIYLVGDGSSKLELMELVKKLKLNEYIEFNKHVDSVEMKKYYTLADVLLLTLRKGQITVPGKLQTYMAIGKPIIGAIDGSGNELINVAKCGRCVNAENYQGLASIIEKYLEEPKTFYSYGVKGRVYFSKHFTLDIYCKKLIYILQKTLKEGL